MPMWRVEVIGYKVVFSVRSLASRVVEDREAVQMPVLASSSTYVHACNVIICGISEMPLPVLFGTALLGKDMCCWHFEAR